MIGGPKPASGSTADGRGPRARSEQSLALSGGQSLLGGGRHLGSIPPLSGWRRMRLLDFKDPKIRVGKLPIVLRKRCRTVCEADQHHGGCGQRRRYPHSVHLGPDASTLQTAATTALMPNLHRRAGSAHGRDRRHAGGNPGRPNDVERDWPDEIPRNSRRQGPLLVFEPICVGHDEDPGPHSVTDLVE